MTEIDFGQVLQHKIDAIIENWVDAVRQDQEIESANELTYKAVLNSLPYVLQALATFISG